MLVIKNLPSTDPSHFFYNTQKRIDFRNTVFAALNEDALLKEADLTDADEEKELDSALLENEGKWLDNPIVSCVEACCLLAEECVKMF